MTTEVENNVLEETTLETAILEKSPWQSMAEANKITNRRTLYAAGIGLIPFPAVDAALVLGVQVWMIRDIAKAYDVEFKEQIVRSLVTTLVGNVAVVGGIKLIPGVGTFVGGFATALSAGAATYALGRVFTLHFNQGGTLLDFDPISSREYFQKAYEEGKLFVSDLQKAEQEKKNGNPVKNLWNKYIKKSPKEEVTDETTEALSTLQDTNDELKAMIAKLQEEMAELKKS